MGVAIMDVAGEDMQANRMGIIRIKMIFPMVSPIHTNSYQIMYGVIIADFSKPRIWKTNKNLLPGTKTDHFDDGTVKEL